MATVFLRDVAARVRSKFRNIPTTVDGKRFASRREARRWAILDLLERNGAICGLRRQVAFPLTAVGADGVRKPIGVYVADFAYLEPDPLRPERPWCRVVEDAKGVRTELFKWKARHFAVEYGQAIRET